MKLYHRPTMGILVRWMQEREAIRVKKELGLPYPWTKDQVLHEWRFCNVRREDDTVTRWIGINIRERYAGHPNLWFMLCIARQINLPSTLEQLMGTRLAWPETDDWSWEFAWNVMDAMRMNGEKVYTSAYLLPSPAEKGTRRPLYTAQTVLQGLWNHRVGFMAMFKKGQPTLQRAHEMILSHPGWGPFLAYQAVVDMRFTHLLENAPDKDDWAAAGPGTLRGLSRLMGHGITKRYSQEEALDLMRQLRDYLRKRLDGLDFDFSDVPNILCEVDKYIRVTNGEGKPRARYVPGRGS